MVPAFLIREAPYGAPKSHFYFGAASFRYARHATYFYVKLLRNRPYLRFSSAFIDKHFLSMMAAMPCTFIGAKCKEREHMAYDADDSFSTRLLYASRRRLVSRNASSKAEERYSAIKHGPRLRQNYRFLKTYER